MTQLNDEVVRVTGGPTYNEGLASWFSKTDDEALQDAERRWLISQGGTPGTNEDMWIEVFGPGQINDVKLAYWSSGGGVSLGPELMTNGDMSSATGWILNINYVIGGGVLTCGAEGDARQDFAVTASKFYRFDYDVVQFTSQVGDGQVFHIGDTLYTNQSAAGVGHYTVDLECLVFTAVGMRIGKTQTNGWLGQLDNFSIKEIL